MQIGAGRQGDDGEGAGGQRYNATRWLEGLVDSMGVPSVSRILAELRGNQHVSVQEADCGQEHLLWNERMGGMGARDSCPATRSWRQGVTPQNSGFEKGSWEFKVQLEVIAALQRVLVHVLHLLSNPSTGEHSITCARECVKALGQTGLAGQVEFALSHLQTSEPGIGATYKNVGILYQKVMGLAEGETRASMHEGMTRVWRIYLKSADGAKDPQASTILSLLHSPS